MVKKLQIWRVPPFTDKKKELQFWGLKSAKYYFAKVVFDDWSWKINKLFWEKSSDVPNEALISLVCKCRLLGLTNAQRPNQQIHISTVRKYMQILEGLYCYMHMLERSVIEITTLTEKDD